MEYEVVLNAEEVREIKKELIQLYKLTHGGDVPSDKWLNRSIEKMFNSSHC